MRLMAGRVVKRTASPVPPGSSGGGCRAIAAARPDALAIRGQCEIFSATSNNSLYLLADVSVEHLSGGDQ